MPRPEQSLSRIVERLGARRLSSDPTLARVALKDFFPDDPLIVSVLTAAVEEGALTTLLDDERTVPLDVLGPRIASDLRRTTGIGTARASWAVAAWAHALGRMPAPLPALPRDGAEPDVRGLFAHEGADPAQDTAVAADAGDDTPTLVPDVENATANPTETPGETPVEAEPEPETETELLPRTDPPADRATEPLAAPVAATTQRVDPEPETLVVTKAVSVGEPDGAEAETVVREAPADPAPVPAPAPAPAPPPPPAPAPAPSPAPKPEPPPRPQRRRIAVLIAAAVVLVLIAAAGVTALLQRPASVVTVSGSAAGATVSLHGSTRTLRNGSTLAPGSHVVAGSAPLALAADGGVIRLAKGTRARVDGATSLTVLAGRAFVHAGSTSLSVGSTAGTAAVHDGRVLVSCAGSECAATSIDETVRLQRGSRTTTLPADTTVTTAGATTLVVPDAIRSDPWFASNDALDRRQHREPSGIAGAAIVGAWTVLSARADLPPGLVRSMRFVPNCGALGCTLDARTEMSDTVPGRALVGTLHALSSGSGRVSIAYGSHPVRCHYVTGTAKGKGADGSETVADTLTFTGSSGSTRLTGTRTTRFTPKFGLCSTAAYTSEKTTTLTGRRGSPSTTDLTFAEQQGLLNYVVSGGSGCTTVTSAPRSGLVSDDQCSYPARGSDPTTLELVTYTTSESLVSAYSAVGTGLGSMGFGDCTTGPCEQPAPNGYGRFRLAQDGKAAVLVTYDPRAAHLLVIARGPSMAGLRSWWSAQQRTHSVYTSAPIPRVGI